MLRSSGWVRWGRRFGVFMSDNMQVREIPAVLLSAARILRTYWAPFVVIACLGLAVRNGALWAAVKVSNINGIAAQFLLILAPLGFLLAMVAMLYLCRQSLPNVQALSEHQPKQAVTEQRELRLVDVAVSVLVPFLAVYVSYGLLEEDLFRFTNETAFAQHVENIDIFGGGPQGEDLSGRLAIWDGRTVVMVIAIAWVLRYALGKFESKAKFLGLAFVGALVEVYYTSQVAQKVAEAREAAVTWAETRAASHAVVDGYDRAVSALGPLANPVDTATAWLFGLLGAVDAVVIVPLAWLTVGAVILGHKLEAPSTTEKLGPEALRERTSAAVKRVPAPVRKFGSGLVGDVRERFSAFWGGLRLMATAGLLPMLTFSIVFLLVLRIPWLFSQGIRQLIGPMKTNTWLAFSPMENAVGLALTMVFAAALLAAAINWLLGPRLSIDSGPVGPRGASDQVSAEA